MPVAVAYPVRLVFTSLGWAGESVRLKGSGASFPFPLYGLWFKEYGKVNRNVIIDYQAKGSGAGIKDFVNKTVDFAASDAAMTDEEMAEIDGGVQLLPMTAGSIVLAYNLPDGPKDLKLSREAYSKIFLGQVTKWNDPADRPGQSRRENARYGYHGGAACRQ